MPQVHQAFNELRNSLWMLAIPLILSSYSFFAVCQWNIQDMQLENSQNSGSQRGIVEVSDDECSHTNRPEGAICATSADWWQPVDPAMCGGTSPCYQLAEWSEWAEAENNYVPLLVPGLVPLILIPLVMRKIARARSALKQVDGAN